MSEETKTSEEESPSVSASRRESLKLFGRYAAAATPAMMVLLGSQKEAEAGWWSRRKRNKKRYRKRPRGSKWY